MRILPIFFFVMLTALVAHAGESDCAGADLRGPRLGAVRRQADSSWCYAYAAADLLSYSTGVRVSAADVALTYFEQKMKAAGKEFDFAMAVNSGGVTKRALENAIENGLCREADLSSEVGRIQDYADALTNEMRREAEIVRLRDSIAKKEFLGYHPACRASRFNQNSIASELGLARNVYVMLGMVEDAQKMDPALAVRNRACEKRWQIMDKPTVVADDVRSGFLTSWAPDRLMDTIDRQLNARNLVSIDYAYNFARADFVKSAPTVMHASTVVGRRWNQTSGTCEYLIRDTAGPDCQSKNANGQSIDRYRFSCEEGSFWVPRDALKAQLQGIEYLKKSTP